MQRHRFESMGTWVECLVEAPPSAGLRDAFARVRNEFARLDRKLSRFRADSELSCLNRERSVGCASDELLELVGLALTARSDTGGRFDPTLHDALVAAGYDRTFSALPHVERHYRRFPAAPAERTGSVRVAGRRIELGPGASLDLGGIAKGWAADRCLPTLSAFGPALINAGGDMAVSGPLASGGWPVGVDMPHGTLTLVIESGGLATSGRDRRRWMRGGEDCHHLIDPRTLRPAAGAPLSVTVTAPSATAAEVASKSLFLADDVEGEAERSGIPAVIVWERGDARLVGVAA